MASFEEYLDKKIPEKIVPFLRLPAVIALLIATAIDIFKVIIMGRVIYAGYLNSFAGFDFQIIAILLITLLFLFIYYKATMVFTHRERAVKLFLNNPSFFMQYKSLHILIVVYGLLYAIMGSFNLISFVLMALLILSVQLGLYSYNREIRNPSN